MTEVLECEESKYWKEAISEKVRKLKRMVCWTPTDQPPDQKPLHAKFVLRKRRIERGELLEYKASLVVCGNEQVDFDDDNFAPVFDFSW